MIMLWILWEMWWRKPYNLIMYIPFWKLSNLIPVDVIQLFINCLVQKYWQKRDAKGMRKHEHGKCFQFCKYWQILSSLRHNRHNRHKTQSPIERLNTETHINTEQFPFSKHFESNLSDNWACIFWVNWNSTHQKYCTSTRAVTPTRRDVRNAWMVTKVLNMSVKMYTKML